MDAPQRRLAPGTRALLPFLLLLALPGETTACPAEAVRLAEARFRLGSLDEPTPIADPGGEPIALPDAWGRTRPGAGGFGWYRIRMTLDAVAPLPCGLRLPDVNANAVVLVNGHWIGQGGSFREPVAHNFNRPLLFPLAHALLRPGENVVDVGVRAYADGVGRLGAVWVGPHAQLARAHERDVWMRTRVAQISTVIGVLALLLVGGIWVTMRYDGAYGWFLLAVGSWTVCSFNFWLRDVPLPHWTWERLVNAALDLAAVALVVWVHRFLGIDRPRLERCLLAIGAVLVSAVVLAPRAVYPRVVLVTHGLAFGFGAFAVLQVVRYGSRLPLPERGFFLGAGVLALGLAGRDYLLSIDPALTGPPTVPVTFSLAVAAFGASLVLRFSRTTREVEALNASLERRVRDREAALARNFERMRELERREVLMRERERIMRDLHDGLGGRLVSALSQLEHRADADADTAAILRDALAEMRMVIDSLDPDLADLPSLLANVRERVEPALERSGLRLAWEIEDVPGAQPLGAEQLLDVLRIVQEAITNAVRHARARTIRVRLGSFGAPGEAPGIEITVDDDGIGIAPAAPAGRGLANMRRRAAALGGYLDVDALEPGTRVRLRLPGRAPGPDQSPSSSRPRLAAS